MYHPAKVKEIVETDTKALFLVETWDENVFTLAGAPDLETASITEGDVVLLDYSPDDRFEMPVAKQIVSAKLAGEQADRVWERYRELFEESNQAQTAMGGPMPNTPFDGGYIG